MPYVSSVTLWTLAVERMFKLRWQRYKHWCVALKLSTVNQGVFNGRGDFEADGPNITVAYRIMSVGYLNYLPSVVLFTVGMSVFTHSIVVIKVDSLK